MYGLDVHQNKLFELDRHPREEPSDEPARRLDYRILKRACDLTLSALLLVLFAPLMILIALALKWTSKESVMFLQRRVGYQGGGFDIYKFRTMKGFARGSANPEWVPTRKEDVTPLGSILRRFNLDELPQLFNVLRGEMSLVGPRPEQPYWVEVFKQQVPDYHLRHRVNTGITGWAQVNGWRGATSIQKRTEHDLYYLRHWSLGLDLKILLLTMTRAFRKRDDL